MKPLITGAVGVCLLLSTEAVAQEEPRIALSAISFKAIHETGPNWPGSDEVYVTIWVPGHAATRSIIFGDVDAGEKNEFPRLQRCIYPIRGAHDPTTFLDANKGDTWQCAQGGGAIPGPFFSFRVVLREWDDCPFWVSCFTPGWEPGTEPGPLEAGDDLIGRHTVVYSKEELMGLQVGQTLVESVRIEPFCPATCQATAEYEFTWQITRIR
jgi:hypothetical protein